MRSFLTACVSILLMSACATTPVMDERAMAQEVFRLSGGLDDVKLVVRLAPTALTGADLGKRCREGLGRNPSIIGATACDMVESLVASLRQGEGQVNRALDAQMAAMEARAVDAMVETYTPSELAAMRRYYGSPEGRAIVAKRSAYLSRLFAVR
jgi:hypothetical protein